MGHPRDTLYAFTCFHYNVRNIRSTISALFTISAIPIAISIISVPISAISVLISATSAISAIFAIPETSAIPALSTCWPSNQVPNIYPFLYFLTFFPYIISWLHYIVYIHSLMISTLLYIITTYIYSVTLYI